MVVVSHSQDKQSRSVYKGRDMIQEDPSLLWWLKAFAYSAFASLGGFIGHLMRAVDKREKISWARAVLEGVAAGFVGLLVLMLCQAMQLSEQWTGVIVGVSGWLGANASIRMLETLVFKKLGITKPETVQPKEPTE